MKIELQPPFDKEWKHGYLVTNKENRKMVCLVNDRKTRKTISYARYIMSVKLGRELSKEEQVDHIDNDKTNDSIDNLQILTAEDNLAKYHALLMDAEHGTYARYRKGCRCDECVAAYREYQTAYYHKHKPRRLTEERTYTDKFLMQQKVRDILGRPKLQKEVVYAPNGVAAEPFMIFCSGVDFNRFVKCGYDISVAIKGADNTYSISKQVVPIVHSETAKHKEVELECEFCHKKFMDLKCNHIGAHIYCSRQCYAAANVGKPGKEQKLHVTKEELLTDMQTLKSYSAVARKYDVTGNSIKKRCKIFGIMDQVQPIIDAYKVELALRNNPSINNKSA